MPMQIVALRGGSGVRRDLALHSGVVRALSAGAARPAFAGKSGVARESLAGAALTAFATTTGAGRSRPLQGSP
jgi:hypothetical protein